MKLKVGNYYTLGGGEIVLIKAIDLDAGRYQITFETRSDLSGFCEPGEVWITFYGAADDWQELPEPNDILKDLIV